MTRRLTDEGAEAVAAVADLTRRDEADAVVEEAMTAFSSVDVIVNTVGGGAGSALYPAESYPEDEWDRIVDLNLRSALHIDQRRGARHDRGRARRAGAPLLLRPRASSASTTGSPPTSPRRARSTRSRASRRPSGPSTRSRSTPSRRRSSPRRRRRACSPTTRSAPAWRRGSRCTGSRTSTTWSARRCCCARTPSSFVTGQILTLDGGLTACQ